MVAFRDVDLPGDDEVMVDGVSNRERAVQRQDLRSVRDPTEGRCCTMNTAAPRLAGSSHVIAFSGGRLPADPPITMILMLPDSMRSSEMPRRPDTQQSTTAASSS
jgi:hypothetical protein